MTNARAMLETAWPASRVADHHHGALYWPTAVRMVVGFARAFGPMAELGVGELESETVLPWSDGLDVRLDLIARYRRGDGAVVGIVFRPESLGESADQSSLNWSELSDVKRSSLALLEHVRPGVTPYVYSGRDERGISAWTSTSTSAIGAGYGRVVRGGLGRCRTSRSATRSRAWQPMQPPMLRAEGRP